MKINLSSCNLKVWKVQLGRCRAATEMDAQRFCDWAVNESCQVVRGQKFSPRVPFAPDTKIHPPILAVTESLSIYRQLATNSPSEQTVISHSAAIVSECPWLQTWQQNSPIRSLLFLHANMNGIVSGTAGLMNIWLWSHFAVFVEEAFISGTTAVLCWQSFPSLSLEDRSDFKAWVRMCRTCSMLKEHSVKSSVLPRWSVQMEDPFPTVKTLLKSTESQEKENYISL